MTALLVVAIPGANAKPPIKSRCDQSIETCVAYKFRDRRLKFEIETSVYSGAYDLCVRPRRGRRECHEFELRSRDGLYFDRVDWIRKFRDPQPGCYRVTWKTTTGQRLGPRLRACLAKLLNE